MDDDVQVWRRVSGEELAKLPAGTTYRVIAEEWSADGARTIIEADVLIGCHQIDSSGS